MASARGLLAPDGALPSAQADPNCAAADFTGNTTCHLKAIASFKTRHDGSVSCVPQRPGECGWTVCQGAMPA